MVANHKNPKPIPKPIAVILDAGKNKNKINIIPLRKYKPLNRNFLEY